MASAQREPVTKVWGRAPAESRGRAPGQEVREPPELKGFVIGTHRREAKVATSESLVGFHSLYCVLSHRIWVILVTRLNVVAARRASVTTLLPLLVSSGRKARERGNGIDNGLFLPHCSVMA